MGTLGQGIADFLAGRKGEKELPALAPSESRPAWLVPGPARDAQPKAAPPREADGPVDPPSLAGEGEGMSIEDLQRYRLELLEEQAARDDERIRELNQELLLHRGGSQHVGQVMALVEGHRGRLGAHAKALADKGEPLTGQAEAEHKATLAGIVDALTYMRAQVKAAELSATRTEAALQEVGRHRVDLNAQGRQQAGKLKAIQDELAAGVDPEMVGRPPRAEDLRQKVDTAKAEAAQPA